MQEAVYRGREGWSSLQGMSGGKGELPLPLVTIISLPPLRSSLGWLLLSCELAWERAVTCSQIALFKFKLENDKVPQSPWTCWSYSRCWRGQIPKPQSYPMSWECPQWKHEVICLLSWKCFPLWRGLPQVEMKPSSFLEFMINLSVQNFIPFLVPSDLNPVLIEHSSTRVRWLKLL